jgi:uncharacterized RDD family membrane protein YckC
VAALIDYLIMQGVAKGLNYVMNPLITPAAVRATQGVQANSPAEGFKLLSALMPAMGVMMAVTIVVYLLYYVGFNTALGATPGKLILGMRILKTDGSKIGVGTALGRYLLQSIFAMLTCGLAYIAILLNDENRGWHDQIMDTMVVDN